ncbi:MAG: MAPEG family protein [Pararhizobium sp.]
MPGSTAIFWPMIAQTLLILVVYLIVSNRRVGSVKRGETKISDYRVPQVEPETSAAAVRNLANQFELPVLFYVVCLSLYVTHGANYFAVALAWLFVVFRVAHASVHLTANDVRMRRPLFIIGLLVVVVLWAWLAIHLAAHV